MTHSGKTTFAHQLRARLANTVVMDQDLQSEDPGYHTRP